MALSWGGTLARKINAEGNLQDFKLQTGSETLVAGTITVTPVVVDASAGGSEIFVSLYTPGAGVLGTHYKVDAVTATSFDITSVDTAGATVATDISLINWAILS